MPRKNINRRRVLRTTKQSQRVQRRAPLAPLVYACKPDPPVLHRTYVVERRLRDYIPSGGSGFASYNPSNIYSFMPTSVLSFYIHAVELRQDSSAEITLAHLPTGITASDSGTGTAVRSACAIRLSVPSTGPFLPSQTVTLFDIAYSTSANSTVDFIVTMIMPAEPT